MIKITFGINISIIIPEDAPKDIVYQSFNSQFEQLCFYGITSGFNIKPHLCQELLNISLFFRKENLYLSANEVEVILALALINEGKVNSF